MNYYEVYVSEMTYKQSGPLTYSHISEINIGSIVIAPYGKKTINGIVSRKAAKPKFKTKEIIEVLSETTIPSDFIPLQSWMNEFYPYGSGPITKLFLPNIVKTKKNSYSDKNIAPKIDKIEPDLTKQQSHTLKEIDNSSNKSFLIHGETGSGKTRIYLELSKKNYNNGKSTIVLVPEISLINQTEMVFREKFGNAVESLHSGLTKKNHNERWLRILESKEPMVIIGTRSAIFAPIKNIGLIIIDEMHEPAYKQDSMPRYNALRVAAKRSRINNALTIYGSATPSIVDYHLAKQTNTPILRMTEKAKEANKVTRQIIDLKNKTEFTKHPYLSDKLIQSISNSISKGQQSLVFLNRRGTAKQIICQNCGWQSLCPRCDLPLTLHADTHTIKCHTCGYSQKPIYSCPECGNHEISYRSLGTKALVEILQSIFPASKIQRFDTDNNESEKLSNNFEAVKDGEVDIIVGTQMLGKGLDLPRLATVGIINADMSLSMPDYSSVERNYQLIHQAIGRVGRGHVDGEIILQTFKPEDNLIKAALNQKWEVLYESELKERDKFYFPPFSFVMKISASRKNSQTAENYLEKIKQEIDRLHPDSNVSEPTPSFYERSHGGYNWHLVIKSSSRKKLTDIAKNIPPGDYICDIDPLNLL